MPRFLTGWSKLSLDGQQGGWGHLSLPLLQSSNCLTWCTLQVTSSRTRFLLGSDPVLFSTCSSGYWNKSLMLQVSLKSTSLVWWAPDAHPAALSHSSYSQQDRWMVEFSASTFSCALNFPGQENCTSNLLRSWTPSLSYWPETLW